MDEENVPPLLARPEEAPSAPSTEFEQKAKAYTLSVYDPQAKELRKLPYKDAINLGKSGYLVGTEAENFHLQQKWDDSPYSKLLSGLGGLVSGRTAGVSDAMAAMLLDKNAQTQLRHADEIHPYYHGAGEAVGFLAGGITGGLMAGGTALTGMAGKGAVKLGSRIGAAAVNAATPGIYAAATRGAAKTFADNEFLEQPQSIEGLAAGSLYEVAANAVAGMTVGAALGIPKALWRKTGNVLDALERRNSLDPMYRKVANQPAQGPHLSRVTVSQEAGYNTETLRDSLSDSKLSTSATERNLTDETVAGKIKQNWADQTEEKLAGSTATKTTTKTPKPGQPVEASPTPEMTQQPLTADEVEPEFQWPKSYKKEAKLYKINEMVVQRLKGDPDALAKYSSLANIEAQIRDLKAATKKGADHNEALTNLYKQKGEIKAELGGAFPRMLSEDGRLVPGYKDLQSEYARVNGKDYIDDAAPEFRIKTPEPPKVKMPKARATPMGSESVTEQEAQSFVENYKLKQSEASEQSFKERELNDTKTKVDEFERAFEHTKDVERRNGKTKYSATFTFPKKPPMMEFAGYKPLISPKTADRVASAAKYPFAAMGYMYGGPAGAIAAAGIPKAAFVGLDAAVGLAGTRYQFGEWFYKNVIKNVETDKALAIGRFVNSPLENKERQITINRNKSFQALANAAQKIKANPSAMVEAYKRMYPSVAQNHPELLHKVAQTAINSITKVADLAPKDPTAPGMQESTYKPPRSQQVAYVNKWQILANPDKALASGDPNAIRLLKECYPAWYKINAEALQARLAEHKKPLRGRAARNISVFLGSPVNPMNDPKAQSRLQQSASMSDANGAQKPPGRAGRNSSAKSSNKATMRDDPTFSPN